MKQIQIVRFIFLLGIVSLTLTSCQGVAEITPTQPTTPPIRPTTLTPKPSLTATPSATAAIPTKTTTPTATLTPSPTPTNPWDDLVLANTPLPLSNEPITLTNAKSVQALGVWGRGAPNAIALSPDGLILGVATNIGGFLYDSLTFETLAILLTPYPTHAIAFSPDNQFLALGEPAGGIYVYDRPNYNLIRHLPRLDQEVKEIVNNEIYFSKGGSELIQIAKTLKAIQISRWESETWRHIRSFSTQTSPVTYVRPELELLGILTKENLILQSLIDPGETKSLPLPQAPSSVFWEHAVGSESEILTNSEGEFVLIQHGSALAYWWLGAESLAYILEDFLNELPSGCEALPETCRNESGDFSWDCEQQLEAPPIELIALTPDDAMVLIALKNGRTEFRRASDGLFAWEIESTFEAVAFSPGSEFFFGVRPDGMIEQRRTLDGNLLGFLDSHPGQLYDLAFSPDGSVLAAGFSDGLIRIFSSANGELLGVLNGHAQSLAFSPDGSWLAGGLSDGTVRIYRLARVDYFDLGKSHQGAVSDLSFSTNGNFLLTGGEDCVARLWDLKDRYAVYETIPGGENPFQIHNVELTSPELIQFFSGSSAGIHCFEGTEQQSILLPEIFGITDLALSPLGDRLGLTGSTSWLLEDPTAPDPPDPVQLVGKTTSETFALAFSPDGTWFVLASSQDLEFWQANQPIILANLRFAENPTHNSRPAELVTSPDGRLIALATGDGLIHLFGIYEFSQN